MEEDNNFTAKNKYDLIIPISTHMWILSKGSFNSLQGSIILCYVFFIHCNKNMQIFQTQIKSNFLVIFNVRNTGRKLHVMLKFAAIVINWYTRWGHSL